MDLPWSVFYIVCTFDTMKKTAFLFLAVLGLMACEPQDSLPETSYYLYKAGFVPTDGVATVTDLGGDKLQISINLKPFTEGMYPAHLHFGGIEEVGELAVELNRVNGETGKSVTVIEGVTLPDGEVLTYQKFLEMNASIKVHMIGDLFSHIVLAYGNVGKNDPYIAAGMSVCVGH